ncbi:MAG: precorrin-6A reductase [Candidatus Methylomirabilia bacterium]
MILLLGGTSEAATISAALAAAGIRVLVSTATDLASSVSESALVSVRTGVLDEAGLHALIVAAGARAVVDATHPYAAAVTENACAAAARAGVPCLRYLRPPAAGAQIGVTAVGDHEEAARVAFSRRRPVLLTIGTRHLAPYLREARRTSVPVAARVLPAPASLKACADAGLPAEQIIPARGPFSVMQNVEVIGRFGSGVLVTKDGGAEGGVPEKLEAARREACSVVLITRPVETVAAHRVFTEFGALVDACVVKKSR